MAYEQTDGIPITEIHVHILSRITPEKLQQSINSFYWHQIKSSGKHWLILTHVWNFGITFIVPVQTTVSKSKGDLSSPFGVIF